MVLSSPRRPCVLHSFHSSNFPHAMIGWIIKKIVGSKNTRLIKSLRPLVARINELEAEYQKLSDDDLRAKTFGWKDELAKLDPSEHRVYLDRILPEAFAVVKNTARRLTERKATFNVCDQPYTWAM